MGQITSATIKMIRDYIARGEHPPLTIHEIDQLTTAWERVQPAASVEPVTTLRHALEHARAWISTAPHGDNCHLDPGHALGQNCECGKESILAHIESALEAHAAPVAQPWQELVAAMYQAAGAYDMPVRFLDALSAAANGESFAHLVDGLLPVACPETSTQNLEDAERYRYLRGRNDASAGVGCWLEADGKPVNCCGWLNGDQLDRAIDAARAAKEPGRG